MAYFYLTLAIIAEVAATSALKASEEFTRLVPSTICCGRLLLIRFLGVSTGKATQLGLTELIAQNRDSSRSTTILMIQ